MNNPKNRLTPSEVRMYQAYLDSDVDHPYELADTLHLEPDSIQTELCRSYRKLNAHSFPRALVNALKNHVITLTDDGDAGCPQTSLKTVRDCGLEMGSAI